MSSQLIENHPIHMWKDFVLNHPMLKDGATAVLKTYEHDEYAEPQKVTPLSRLTDLISGFNTRSPPQSERSFTAINVEQETTGLFPRPPSVVVMTNKIQFSGFDFSAPKNVAIDSRFLVNGQEYHMPMIDFKSKTLSDKTVEKLILTYREKYDCDIYIYQTNHSFHLYGTTLLTKDEWLKDLGDLLLFEGLKDAPEIDRRWVGHQIKCGYSALRWSKKEGCYPTLYHSPST